MESFFHTLKVERVEGRACATKAEAAADINWWIGTRYNQRRFHSSLGYVPPLEYDKSKRVA